MSLHNIKSIWKEVIAMELQKWETPEFEEIGTSAEVTAYVFLGEE
jgi:coenzyme PQQ precursor peptide PqqA